MLQFKGLHHFVIVQLFNALMQQTQRQLLPMNIHPAVDIRRR
jgi:hypothetical protein